VVSAARFFCAVDRPTDVIAVSGPNAVFLLTPEVLKLIREYFEKEKT